jgi:hypothetical protein
MLSQFPQEGCTPYVVRSKHSSSLLRATLNWWRERRQRLELLKIYNNVQKIARGSPDLWPGRLDSPVCSGAIN